MVANPIEAVDDEHRALELRLGGRRLRQRLGLEAEHEAFVFGRGIRFFHLENWYSVHAVIRAALRVTGLYGRARRNACALRVVEHDLVVPGLAPGFEGLRILHLSDLHVDMDPAVTHALVERVRDLDYDLCVLTGDYRARTYGPFEAVLDGMEALRLHLKDPVYGVLGNHDSIRLVMPFEDMGIRMLINESVTLQRGHDRLYLAGIDDAHYFRTHSLEAAAADIPEAAPAILLSHTPEIYRQAAHAGFHALLCGHTHGGQICLPGGFPLTWDADCPRALAAGAWRHYDLRGYTSVGCGTSIVNARLNCPPEVTIHRLQRHAHGAITRI